MGDGITVQAYFTRSHGRWMLVVIAPRWLVDDALKAAYETGKGHTNMHVGSYGGCIDQGSPHSFNIVFGDQPPYMARPAKPEEVSVEEQSDRAREAQGGIP
jgi:hypothetical protein